MAHIEAPAAPAAVSAPRPRDPLGWCLLLTGLFALLTGWRLAIPSQPYFDEIHYLPAARELLELLRTGQGTYLNREHPLLAKELIAAGMALFGDNPLGWRIMPWLAGVLAYGAMLRAMWHASHDRYAMLAFAVLLATGFHLFIHARIAMLDIVMASALAVAAWQFAVAIARPEQGRLRLALTGIAIGCALAAKWNAIPLAVMPGLIFLVARAFAGRRRLLLSRRGAPVPGITLIEAFVWLGLLPLAVYAATFLPGYWLSAPLHPSPLAERGLIGLHQHIYELQSQLKVPHRYMSQWPQWVLDTRGIWYLYQEVDGAQRGVLLIGNPLSMWLGLPALVWCLVAGLFQRSGVRLAAALGYAVSLGLWVIAPKPVQFYYHYLVPSFFLLAALALTCSDLRRLPKGDWLAGGVLAGAVAVFAVFFPIIAALPLSGPDAYLEWMWLSSWK